MALTKATYRMTQGQMVNVVDFGATGDGSTDDTDAIQAALTTGNDVFIPNGTYKVAIALSDCLKPVSNQKIVLEENATLSAIDSSNTLNAIFFLQDVNHVTIQGGKLVGDRAGHTGSGQEAHGFWLEDSDYVTIRDCHISDCWGDGIYTGNNPGHESEYLTIDNVVCDNNRRQGLSITTGRHIVVTNSYFINTNGAAPSAGIDLENNSGTDVRDITIQGCVLKGNDGHGIASGPNGTKNFRIIGCDIAENGLSGVSVNKVVDNVVINGNTIYDNAAHGVILRGGGTSPYEMKGFIVSNNNIKSNDNHGIYIADDIYDGIITGNNIINNRWHGVIVEGYDTGRMVISCNNIYNNSQDTTNTYSGIYFGAFARNHVVTNNSITGSDHKYGIHADNLESNVINNNQIQSASTANTLIGYTSGQFTGNGLPLFYSTAAPTTGTWQTNTIVLDNTPSAGGTIGWVCTSGGTPGTWKAFGTIAV